MNVILSVILLLISGVNSRLEFMPCPMSNGKFPVENSDCKSYYVCENWKVTNKKTCPEGQNFNPSLQWCDYEDLYYCSEKEIKKYKLCKKSSGRFPKENSLCRGYYVCEKWKVTGEYTCPVRQNFNPDQERCDWEELYPCLEGKPSGKCPKPNGFFPKLGSQCKSYYQCINGKPYELHCPDDLVFDSEHSHCEWPELYSCDETGVSTTAKTSRTAYSTTQPTTSTLETSPSTERKETMKTTKEYFTTTSTERTKSTAETRTGVTTASVPTAEVSQSTKTERTIETTPTTETSSKTTEISQKYTVSSTDGTSSTRTNGTTATPKNYSTAPTEETSPYSTEETVQTSTLSTGGMSFGTETPQTPTGRTISNPSTANTKIDTFSTASIGTNSPGEIVCPGRTGLFPHPSDETKFLSCLDFQPTVMNCPDDLIYDPAQKRCNWRKRFRI